VGVGKVECMPSMHKKTWKMSAVEWKPTQKNMNKGMMRNKNMADKIMLKK